MADVARGSLQHGSTFSAFMSLSKRATSRRGQVEVVHAELLRLAQQRVVDVGDVAHAARVVAEIAEAALQHVVGDVDRRVTEVRRVVRRDAARVHRDELGPGSNGTTALRAVSYRRMGTTRS